MTTQAIKDVLTERLRQVREEGFNDWHDDQINNRGELVQAAVSMALYANGTLKEKVWYHWPVGWARSWLKGGSRRRLLVKAAALLIAEIERLDRNNH